MLALCVRRMDGWWEREWDNNNYTARRDCLIPVPEINTSQFAKGSGGMSEKSFILSLGGCCTGMGMPELRHQYVIMVGCHAARFRNGLARLRVGDEVPPYPLFSSQGRSPFTSTIVHL